MTAFLLPRFLHIHNMLAVFRSDDEADADEWDVGFGIGIARLIVARGVLKFDGHATLQHQEEASAKYREK